TYLQSDQASHSRQREAAAAAAAARIASSDEDDASSNGDDEDSLDFDPSYYDNTDEDMLDGASADCRSQPQHQEYETLSVPQVEQLLNEAVEAACSALELRPATARRLLIAYNWNLAALETEWRRDRRAVMQKARILPPDPCVSGAQRPPLGAPMPKPQVMQPGIACQICCLPTSPNVTVKGLACGHVFCTDCWQAYVATQLQASKADVQCMERDCALLATDDLVLACLTDPAVRRRFHEVSFRAQISSHPQLAFCTRSDCTGVLRAKQRDARLVVCAQCKSAFCFACGLDYHAPTDCALIKRWLLKCRDDSETANYISAHTKDCPKCGVCIEKNGGCNHMQCFKCRFDFCWVCLGDWRQHGKDFYECSKYKENPSMLSEAAAGAQAREALRKYLHYFTRWDNHGKSLRLEADALKKIRDRIEERVMLSEGTWIDWQYLIVAAEMLRRCRYTLQYTYPYAYFLPKGHVRKELFEYQQAMLEKAVEDLSFLIERADLSDRSHRGQVENQMFHCEKMREFLVKEFH
uniref:RBR-type E3 ubiquitin transferase n=2 Tax=Macrostomum lignano TaxID=282301 RepID=A0A1I8HLI3_9PLAT